MILTTIFSLITLIFAIYVLGVSYKRMKRIDKIYNEMLLNKKTKKENRRTLLEKCGANIYVKIIDDDFYLIKQINNQKLNPTICMGKYDIKSIPTEEGELVIPHRTNLPKGALESGCFRWKYAKIW